MYHVYGYCTNHHLGMVLQGNPLPNSVGMSRGNLKKKSALCSHLYQPFTSNSLKTKDLNAMDIDVVHIGKLTLEERKCCIEKGLCFHCCKAGHLSGECPSFPNKKPEQQVKRIVKEKELPNLWEVDDDDKETV